MIMKKTITLFFVLFFTLSLYVNAQQYSFSDFVGVWEGTISSQNFTPYNDPITLQIEPNGFYTETSGHLMPTIYPNTQQCEYDAATNRLHFWYLYLVYAGQYNYQHIYHEVVYFNNDTLELHYNFWDDPVPQPQAQTIKLVKKTTVGIDDVITNNKSDKKELVRVVDITGRVVSPDTRGTVLILYYDDGSVEKIYRH